MIKKQLFVFVLRWLASSVMMFFCISWFGRVNSTETFSAPWVLYAVAGLIFSLVNSILKPLLKLFALPLAILTLGVSTLVINAAMVILTIYLVPGVEMDFWGAFISSLLLSGANAVLTFLIA